MNDKSRKRPRDFNQAEKLVVDIATGQVDDRQPTQEEQGKDPAAGASSSAKNPRGAEVEKYLGWHCIASVRRHGTVSDVGLGEALLAAAHDEGADLLAMGGFGHAPWREFLFGAATRDLVATNLLPLLLSH